MLDVGNSGAVALEQGAEVGDWVLCCECLLFPISLDGSNEEDEFPQGGKCNMQYLTLLKTLSRGSF